MKFLKHFFWMLMLAFLITIPSMNASAKKVHTLGDSTMAPYDENVTNTRGWGMYFGNFLTNGWTSVNYAKGGRDSRGGYNELWQNAKNNVEAGDYVLIQFAHNDTQYSGMDNLQLQEYYTNIGDATQAAAVKKDGRGTIPSSTYKECLKQICDAVKEKGATPILVSSVCRCYFTNGVAPITRTGRHDIGGSYKVLTASGPVNGTALPETDHTMDYTYQMQQLAQQEGVQFIDMTAATKSLYESYETYDKCYAALFDKGGEKDNTHYNLTGALTAARLCAQLIKEAGILTDAIEIPTDLAISPSTVDLGEGYLGKTAMKEMTLSGLGLDPAAGSVTVTASDGIMLSTDKQNWVNSLDIDYENGTLIKTFYARVTLSAVGQFNGTVTATLGSKSSEVPVTINVVELGGGDPFTVNWTMSPTDKASATVSDATKASATDVTYENLGTYGYMNGYGALIAPTGSSGAWPTAAIDDQNQYVQFAVTAPEGKKLDISNIAMKIKAQGGGSLQCHVYCSTDGFVTRKTLFSTSAALTGTWNEINYEEVVKVEEGDQLLIRVYPWSGNVDSGRWICISDVAVSGQSKDAAGVNITGNITYTLDKGGLTQGDDAVFDPETLSACFAGKSWSAGSALTVDGLSSYSGASDEAKITQTSIANKSGASLASTAGKDNTLTLTLTPEDGFSFVPSKLTFQAARYGTDGGNISASVDAGETHVDLVNNQGVNRGGKNLTIASFSEAIDGITATADNPLKVNFSFLGLGNTKTMGLSNVVIEGQLVGAQAQVTKYMLNTQVVPSAEAGSITRSPEMEQYKEGSTVTLKATKNFGYKFAGWQDETGATVSTDAETTVTMDAEKTMKAVFEAVPVYTVTTKVANDSEREGLGSITLTPNDHDGQYEEGTQITAVANESKIIKFTNWEDNSASVSRTITVNENMTITANYEVQDFIAVFDASKTADYAYTTTSGYPFSADEVWDANRNAKSSIVRVSDGSLCYTQTGGTPVVRNRVGVVISGINGLYQNGYNTSDIAWQYQFSTVGFTSAKFVADMCAKNGAKKQYKALISIAGGEFTELKSAWDVTANVINPVSIDLPAEAIGKESVVIRITGTGDDTYNTTYPFDKTFDGLSYCDHSEAGVGNVFILGDAVVEEDATAPEVTSTIPENDATAVSASGRITVTFNERIESANSNGAVTLGSEVLTPTWSSRSVSFDYTGLDYNTAYTFSMPANYVQDKSGNKYAEPVTINFTTMSRPTVTKALYDFIVPDDGTIDEALAAANNRENKSVRYRVFIKNSDEPYVFHPEGSVTGGDGKTYDNPTSVLSAANTSFIGESIEGVVITNVTPDATWNNGFGAACPLEGIGKGDVLQIKGADAYFQNLTIKTSMGDAHGRDIAVNDQANRTIFKDAQLWGYQDTYVSNNQNGKFYFEGGIIRGRTDYMCGKGDVYYNKVTLRQVASGYAAVPSLPKKYGYIYQSCKIIGDSNSGVDGNYTLGRPWGKGTPIALFIDTEMEVKPSAIGWSEMSGGYPARFAEYGSHGSTGALVSTEGRKTEYDAYDEKNEVKDENGNPVLDEKGNKTYTYVNRRTEYNNPILTADEAAVPTLKAVMGQDDDWQPTLLTEQAPVPSNVSVAGATVSWDNSPYALLYAVCKDGKVIDFTTEATYTATENGSYSVRAANEMGGLSAASLTVEVTDASAIANVNADDNANLNVNAPVKVIKNGNLFIGNFNVAGQRIK
ncbi:MAG: Ig-like domain-containing protein [Prevotella sp.]|nr:Ig-like domain-containing protein [Prevotella sp.]